MNKQRYILIALLVVCLTGSIAVAGYFLKNDSKTMSYTAFLNYAEQGEVDTVAFNKNEDQLTVQLKGQETTYQMPHPKTDTFVEFLLLHDISVTYEETSNMQIFAQVLLVAACVLVIAFNIRHRKKSAFLTDENTKKDRHPSVTLNDIAGNTEAKSMVLDVIQFIRQPEKYSAIGAKMPRGLLLYGPPGTGKTLMAKAIAADADVPFYAINGSDFMQMYVGVGASRVRDLFKKAKKSEKAVIFIDEIDTIGKKRSSLSISGNDERDQTLNALLSEMSGFHEREGIVVIAATNRMDILDEALIRPGRFDRQIEIGLPDIQAREKILELHCRSKILSEEIDLHELARSTVYFSGAMLENLLNEAAILAVNENNKTIRKVHIDKAFYTIVAGAEKTDRDYLSKRDREITAYHEAGHALLTKLLLPDHFLSKVTIIPSVKGAGGFSLSIPRDTAYFTKKQLEANIQVFFAGRAAEELIFGPEDITTGASNDIQKASGFILNYVTTYGMDGELGLFHLQSPDAMPDAEVLKRCRQTSNELYLETKRTLESHLQLLKEIALALLEKESLNDDDICRIIFPVA